MTVIFLLAGGCVLVVNEKFAGIIFLCPLKLNSISMHPPPKLDAKFLCPPLNLMQNFYAPPKKVVKVSIMTLNVIN